MEFAKFSTSFLQESDIFFISIKYEVRFRNFVSQKFDPYC